MENISISKKINRADNNNNNNIAKIIDITTGLPVNNIAKIINFATGLPVNNIAIDTKTGKIPQKGYNTEFILSVLGNVNLSEYLTSV